MNELQFIEFIDAIVGAILGAFFAYASTYFFYFRSHRMKRHAQFKINIANLVGLLYEAKEHWFLIIEYYYLKKIEIMETPKYRLSKLKLADSDFESYRIRMISLNSQILKSVEVVKSFQLKFGTRTKNRILALNLDGNEIPESYIDSKTLKRLSPDAICHLVNLQFNRTEEMGGHFDRILDSLNSKLSEDEQRFSEVSNKI